jgi:cobyrinic acid a,c-diamide synthase
MFITELTGNHSLRCAINAAVEAGMPVYAECGGLMYLSRSLRWNQQVGEMVGVIPGDAVMGTRPVGRGYAVLQQTPAMPWPTSSPSLSASLPAHEFHYSHLENLQSGLTYAYRVLRGQGIDGEFDGYAHKNLLASYCHRRGSGPDGWIGPFLSKVSAYRSQRQPMQKVSDNLA